MSYSPYQITIVGIIQLEHHLNYSVKALFTIVIVFNSDGQGRGQTLRAPGQPKQRGPLFSTYSVFNWKIVQTVLLSFHIFRVS